MGHVLCHDMTQIIKDEYKDARFRKGHVVTEEDIPVLLSHGQGAPLRLGEEPRHGPRGRGGGAAAAPCVGQEQHASAREVKEGKIELTAACDGAVSGGRRSGSTPSTVEDEVMIATRHGQHGRARRETSWRASASSRWSSPRKSSKEAEAAAGHSPCSSLHALQAEDLLPSSPPAAR